MNKHFLDAFCDRVKGYFETKTPKQIRDFIKSLNKKGDLHTMSAEMVKENFKSFRNGMYVLAY